MKVITYLHFPGQAEEAINFYKDIMGAEVIMLNRMGEGPMDIPENLKNKIMHARLQIGDTLIYLSDTFDEFKINKGNNVALSLEVDEPAKVDSLFEKLSAGG
jgi:PhnB protein